MGCKAFGSVPDCLAARQRSTALPGKGTEVVVEIPLDSPDSDDGA